MQNVIGASLLVGPLTVAECLEILNQRKSVKPWISTNIVLIPKVQSPKLVVHFRAISLCSMAYKIVSKLVIV